MLSNAKEKLIKELHTKKGREKHGLCLVEGKKAIDAADDSVEFTFTRNDTRHFDDLVTTETPQDIAAVARIPDFTMAQVLERSCLVVLDGVQDPGNVGTIARLCKGYEGSLLLVESADMTNPKVIRSSAGTSLSVPWLRIARDEASAFIDDIGRPIYRLERHGKGASFELSGSENARLTGNIVLILGAEGKGITLDTEGTSLIIPHSDALESLNVGHAAAIAMYVHHTNR